MKDAKAQSQPISTQSSVLGKAEKLAGDVTGCEGMQREGVARDPAAGGAGGGVEGGSGTG